MSGRQIALGVVLVAFAAESAAVVLEHGAAFFDLAFANTVTMLIGIDLVIALGLVSLWMIGDARERGVTPWPYLGLTLLTGSVGPLLYLLLRERGRAAAHAGPARA